MWYEMGGKNEERLKIIRFIIVKLLSEMLLFGFSFIAAERACAGVHSLAIISHSVRINLRAFHLLINLNRGLLENGERENCDNLNSAAAPQESRQRLCANFNINAR